MIFLVLLKICDHGKLLKFEEKNKKNIILIENMYIESTQKHKGLRKNKIHRKFSLIFLLSKSVCEVVVAHLFFAYFLKGNTKSKIVVNIIFYKSV